jgi:hypothetical protein
MPKLRPVIRQKKREYLKRAGTVGGDKEEFRRVIDDDFLTHPENYNVRAAVLEAADRIWDENEKTDGPDLFSINGVTLARSFTFPDLTREGQYRKVDCEFASVFHLREDAILTIRSGGEIVAAGEAKMKLADEALRRAAGNPSTLLKTIID